MSQSIENPKGSGGKPSRVASKTPEQAAFLARLERRLLKIVGVVPLVRHDFKRLYKEESQRIGDPPPDSGYEMKMTPAGEPWIAFTPKDHFGLALSGGGIRSATFNLGVLQALATLDITRHVDYLSTVSGGGYVGGFWTAWNHRNPDDVGKAGAPFAPDDEGQERREIRHLREFSRFLLPRVGILETEFWGIVMTVLGGTIPAIIAALCLLVLGWCGWIALLTGLSSTPGRGAGVLIALVMIYLGASEWSWLRAGKAESSKTGITSYVISGGIIVAAIGGVWCRFLGPWLGMPGNWSSAFESTRLFLAPAATVAASALVALFVRGLLVRPINQLFGTNSLVGFERSVTRILGLAAALVAAGSLWATAQWLLSLEKWRGAIGTTGGVAALSAALFAWLKNWLAAPVVETRGSSLLRWASSHLRQATPKLLAWVAVTLAVALVAAGVMASGKGLDGSAPWLTIGILSGCVVFLLLTAVLLDPTRIGLHDFYRSRISRCYLGASNPQSRNQAASANRQTSERAEDDLELGSLRGVHRDADDVRSRVQRPHHLICVAANEMCGDRLASLYRGARSAVLSADGLTLGNSTVSQDDLRLSSALTASAAAFNSQMGRISMDLGPAVTFLMSALNLRLGLWVDHPAERQRSTFRFPGSLFLKEMLGRSTTSGEHLHLSDGGHFENLGVYELIRRHCRYIVVSDCGADPDFEFEDLANALRRVREDFGVEIELDVSALRPNAAGVARQHAVVGTIHYNGVEGMDKGSIIYFKPVLTGDEPPDVQEYRTRNPSFPQQSTGDQFYDEAQWESYRRLGAHAGRAVLGTVDPPVGLNEQFVDRMFYEARRSWHAAPDRQKDSFLDMSDRCAGLEAELVRNGPSHLLREFFPEAVKMSRAPVQFPEPGVDEEVAALSYLMRVLQIMEDTWLAGDLDHYWSHPLNEGWMAYFHRWADTPSLRRWWPVLSPIYGPGFRDFARERFGLGVRDDRTRGSEDSGIAAARLDLVVVQDATAFESGELWQQYLREHPDATTQDRTVLRYALRLLSRHGEAEQRPIDVGFAVVTEWSRDGEWTAEWTVDDLFVPDRLMGAGFTGRLLEAVIASYRNREDRSFRSVRVHFRGGGRPAAGGEPRRRRPLGLAARYERVRSIEFYKSRGFEYASGESPGTGEITLVLSLASTGG